MAKKLYLGINDTAANIKDIYVGVNGKARRVIRGYVGVNGKARPFWGKFWDYISTLPFDCYQSAAVVYNGRIHILGGANNPRIHYSWDESTDTWHKESDLPYDFINGGAAVYNGYIHIFGTTGWSNQHYKWGGENWILLTSTPYAFNNLNNAQIFLNKVCLVSSGYGHYSQFRYIQQWDDDTGWTAALIPNNNSFGNSCVYKNKIYLLGNSGTAGTEYETWDGVNFSGMIRLPNHQFRGGYALRYHDRIQLIGGIDGKQRRHYSFDGENNIREESHLPFDFYYSPAVVYKKRLHIFGKSHYQYLKDDYNTESPFFKNDTGQVCTGWYASSYKNVIGDSYCGMLVAYMPWAHYLTWTPFCLSLHEQTANNMQYRYGLSSYRGNFVYNGQKWYYSHDQIEQSYASSMDIDQTNPPERRYYYGSLDRGIDEAYLAEILTDFLESID